MLYVPSNDFISSTTQKKKKWKHLWISVKLQIVLFKQKNLCQRQDTLGPISFSPIDFWILMGNNSSVPESFHLIANASIGLIMKVEKNYQEIPIYTQEKSASGFDELLFSAYFYA